MDRVYLSLRPVGISDLSMAGNNSGPSSSLTVTFVVTSIAAGTSAQSDGFPRRAIAACYPREPIGCRAPAVALRPAVGD